ncbi:DUF6962 family protein [Candidatus Berkiella aquae]|uniref:FAD-binding protein n=1 Tax=Candidatus Berkiella aquae TaxID=295108 RepID=A0A0Q9YYZ5_9GAMM|nr:FAD-binding protein [Candidatus Berkiella aquae]MCS5710371.1 FAD-binding protein [Candidatus Berkiella aquae]
MISVAITNLILGIESFILAWFLIKHPSRSTVRYDCIIILLGISVASVLSALWHIKGGDTLWKVILMIVGVVAGGLGSAALGILWPQYHRWSIIVFTLITIGYIELVRHIPEYAIAIYYYAPCALLLFYALTIAYRQTKNRQIRYGIIAMVLLVLAPLFQQSMVSVENVPGSLLYNIIMIPCIYLCYLAVAAVLMKHNTEGFKEVYVNDLHSQMNETVVSKIVNPQSVDAIKNIIVEAKNKNQPLSICGARHAMGGQQFAENSILLDTTNANKVLALDPDKGRVKVQAGITWPKLLNYLHKTQASKQDIWTFAQKQTGADDLTIGGALSANIHGRGLCMKPFVQDIVSFELINAQGELLPVSRQENKELFSLAIGGYGLFGVVPNVEIQLVKRQVLQRKVTIIPVTSLAQSFQERINEGFLYGDFQFMTDEKSSDYLQKGVFSCYQPTTVALPEKDNRFLNKEDWNKLLLLAHVNKAEAFKRYSDYYLSTDGQCYWSDTHQLGFYNEKYIEYIRSFSPDWRQGSLMITEIYVPLSKITEFMTTVANDPQLRTMNIIYGTVRLIKQDDETFLPWAKQDYACIIFNLFVPHTNSGFQYAAAYFSGLIDHALSWNGSFFLTYHRYARKDQILQAYPQFQQFLAMKLKYDPDERFQSSWYQFYKRMFLTSNHNG